MILAGQAYRHRGLMNPDGSYGFPYNPERVIRPLSVSVSGKVWCRLDVQNGAELSYSTLDIMYSEFDKMEREGVIVRIYVEAGEGLPEWLPPLPQ